MAEAPPSVIDDAFETFVEAAEAALKEVDVPIEAVRRWQPRPGVIFHSDRGSEYVAAAFRDRLRALGIQQSSTQRGPGDNAHVESFFHSLKAELLHGTRFASEAMLRGELLRYIHYYNHHRRHSALAYRSPADYESWAA